MKKCLVSAGCSFAFGANLRSKQNKYSVVIAEQLGQQLVDVSISGASNQHVASLALHGINKALRSFKPEEITLVVGWTDQSRLLYFDKEDDTVETCFTNWEKHVHSSSQTRYPIEVGPLAIHNKQKAEIAKFVSEKLWSAQAGYFTLMHCFALVDNFCKANKIDVIHLANLELFDARFVDKSLLHPTNPNYTPLTTTDLIDILDNEQRVRFRKLLTMPTFWDVVRKNKLHVADNDRHPNAEAHHIWAERIMNDYESILGPKLRAS